MEQNQEEGKYVNRTGKRQRFDTRLIKAIVQSVEDGLPQQEAMGQYGMTRGTLISWLNKTDQPLIMPVRNERSIPR
jgi:DNA invertase Pin-like site-specific DNA recombinase